MAPKSRLEIDFQRLLYKCENDMAMQNENLSPQGWRLEKYIEALEDKLGELYKLNSCQPAKDDLSKYKKKVKFLKGLVEAEKLKSPSEKLMATQLLSPSSVMPSHDKTLEIYLQTQSKHSKAIRDELFGSGNTSLRNRKTGKDSTTSEQDVDLVVKYHHEMQEKVAEEMVSLAMNLKDNMSLASQIIKKDVEVLEGSARVAGGNSDNLRNNSDKLTDFVRRSCQYWLWIMMGLVSFTFLWIVVFIRMFPKKVERIIIQSQQQS